MAHTYPPTPPCALQAGNRLWHPLIAHCDLASLCNVEVERIPIRHFPNACRD